MSPSSPGSRLRRAAPDRPRPRGCGFGSATLGLAALQQYLPATAAPLATFLVATAACLFVGMVQPLVGAALGAPHRSGQILNLLQAANPEPQLLTCGSAMGAGKARCLRGSRKGPHGALPNGGLLSASPPLFHPRLPSCPCRAPFFDAMFLPDPSLTPPDVRWDLLDPTFPPLVLNLRTAKSQQLKSSNAPGCNPTK